MVYQLNFIELNSDKREYIAPFKFETGTFPSFDTILLFLTFSSRLFELTFTQFKKVQCPVEKQLNFTFPN